jgi:hypothetical protein
MAQRGLAELVDATVAARRLEAMQAAMRFDLINLAVDYAVGSAMAFTAPGLAPERRRELAHRAVVAELATALRLPERTMSRLVSDAWTLATRLPVTLAALRSGAVDESHARVIVDETADVDESACARLDVELSGRAESTTAARLRRIARRLREEILAESLIDRHARARAERRIELEPARDGMAWLHLHLAASDALLIRDRVDRVAADAVRPVPGNAAGGVGGVGDAGRAPGDVDRRTPDQVRADVARDLLLHGVPPIGEAFHVAAATIRPTVHVTVPVLTLLGLDEAPAELDGYGPIDPDTARALAARAPSFSRLLTDPITGAVLDVDRTRYRPPADLVRWLRVRDETCRFPGCGRAAARSEVDHTEAWSEQGSTAFDNLAHLCSSHHHLKHETSWSVRHLDGGTLEWRSPAGRRHRTEPAVRIPPRAAAAAAQSAGPVSWSPPAGTAPPRTAREAASPRSCAPPSGALIEVGAATSSPPF